MRPFVEQGGILKAFSFVRSFSSLARSPLKERVRDLSACCQHCLCSSLTQLIISRRSRRSAGHRGRNEPLTGVVSKQAGPEAGLAYSVLSLMSGKSRRGFETCLVKQKRPLAKVYKNPARRLLLLPSCLSPSHSFTFHTHSSGRTAAF